MKQDLVKELGSRYLLADGAMGTELHKLGAPVGGCAELWNVEQPDRVGGVHQAYIAAGCDCLTTNTFGANRFRLEERGVSGSRVAELNSAAVALARDAAGDTAWVLGCLGPCAGQNVTVGALAEAELVEAYAQQMSALAAAGVDALVLETMTDLAEIRAAASAWKNEALTVPLFISLAFMRGRHGQGLCLPRSGEPLDLAIEQVVALAPAGVGSNCGVEVDIFEYSTIVAAIRARFDGPVLAQPNAGQAAACGGGFECTHPPEMMVEGVWGLVRAGANLLGGCCGTSPDHIRLFREELDRL